MRLFSDYGRPLYNSALGRWMGVGPYYAMFPMRFAFEVVSKYVSDGGSVLDPFAGRSSSVYAAAALGYTGVGIEINPVGWLYGRVKLQPSHESWVLKRLRGIGKLSENVTQNTLKEMPEFYKYCYAPNVLRFLITARNELNWQESIVDATLMSIILVYLHGKRKSSLSNQMRQSKAMHHDYSVRWWRERDLSPPDIAPIEFLESRIKWRYAKGRPNYRDSQVILGDSLQVLKDKRYGKIHNTAFSLLFTSPPYYDITNYHYDQWLRLWMLGGSSLPRYDNKSKWQKKFSGQEDYKMLLRNVFSASTPLLADDAVIYIRTDARKFTYNTTLEILCEMFPNKQISSTYQPFPRKTQTALFGDKEDKPGEYDIVLI